MGLFRLPVPPMIWWSSYATQRQLVALSPSILQYQVNPTPHLRLLELSLLPRAAEAVDALVGYHTLTLWSAVVNCSAFCSATAGDTSWFSQ